MSKFNPTTATPDDIAEFVKSLSDEELRNSLVHSFLQMRQMHAEYSRILKLHQDNCETMLKGLEDGKIIILNQ